MKNASVEHTIVINDSLLTTLNYDSRTKRLWGFGFTVGGDFLGNRTLAYMDTTTLDVVTVAQYSEFPVVSARTLMDR